MNPHSEITQDFFKSYTANDQTAARRSAMPQVDRFNLQTMSSSSSGLPVPIPNYNESRGWSEMLPGRNVPINFFYKWTDNAWDKASGEPSRKVGDVCREPHQVYSWDRNSRRGNMDTTEALLRDAEDLAQRPLAAMNFGSMRTMPRGVQSDTQPQYRGQMDAGQQPLIYRNGVERARDHYRMQEGMWALPRLYRSLEPLYRFPDALQNKEALETGRKWREVVRDGMHNRQMGGSILPRCYGKMYSDNASAAYPWKYQDIRPETFPSYDRFERDHPSTSGSRFLHSLKYDNYLQKCRACPTLDAAAI